jgi:hypothetical protein
MHDGAVVPQAKVYNMESPEGYRALVIPLAYLVIESIYVEFVCPRSLHILRAYILDSPIGGDIVTVFREDYPGVFLECMKRRPGKIMLNRTYMNAAFNGCEMHPSISN